MNAPVTYNGEFLPVEVADDWFVGLWETLPWLRLPDVPRREYWHTTQEKPYTYGRGRGIRTYAPQPLHHTIDAAREELLHYTHRVLGDDIWFEGCFLNGYEDGRDALGWHADDDPGIDHSKPIAIISLYAPGTPSDKLRAIQFKAQDGPPGEIETLTLGHGSLALMSAGMQDTHYHRIPKAGFVAPPRISLTFRGLV